MGRHFLWDPISDNIVKEFDDAGNTIVDYTTEPFLHGDVISQRRDGQSSFYHFDGQGNTTSLTDERANITDTYAYNAFGEVTDRTGNTVNPFQYIGQKGYYRDEEAEEYLARRRLLSPELASWLSVDPLNFSGQIQSYQYVLNCPTLFRDPSGLQAEVPSTLPDLTDFTIQEKDKKDVAACTTFYKEKLQTNPAAVKCYQDYFKKVSKLENPLLRKECQRLRFSCICCDAHAQYVQGFIFLCANTPSVKNMKAEPTAQSLCHEIVHALQFAPCNEGSPKQDDVSCLERLKLEFQAYLCAGQCLDGAEVDPFACVIKSVGSARKGGKCGPLSDVDFKKQVGLFEDWVIKVFPTLDMDKYCPTQYHPPKKR